MLSDAQNFDRHNGNGLIAEYSFVGLNLPGDIGVLNHLRQPQILNPCSR